MIKDTLYLKIEQNVQVHNTHVTLGDIAALECGNKEILPKLKTMKIENATTGKPGRHAMSVLDIIAAINQEYPGLTIDNVGEADFIITLEKPRQPGGVVAWSKTAAVCILAFFGAAFTIMTFNNDVDIPKLFGQLYLQFTGQQSDGFTVLEFTYSVGVGLGILIFFNHFAGRKLTADPTPMEVEMRLYEDDINKTLIEADSRDSKKKPKKK